MRITQLCLQALETFTDVLYGTGAISRRSSTYILKNEVAEITL
jgi:hypothetical protein